MRRIAFWSVTILVFIIPWENVVVIPGVGTISRVVGLLIAGIWLLAVAVRGNHRKLRLFHLVVFVYFFWHLLSYFWSIDDERTMGRIVTYLQLGLMTVMLWDVYTTSAAMKVGLQAYVLGAFVSISSVIMNYLAARQVVYLRYSATGFDVNDVSLILALGIPVAWYLAITGGASGKVAFLRVVNFAYVPLAVLAILLTASRGGFIAMVWGALFVLGSLMRLNLVKGILVLVVLAGALYFLQPIVPRSSYVRLATLGRSISEVDLGNRGQIWSEGLEHFYDHPVTGVGSYTFASAIPSKRVAHNAYLSVLVEVGLVGLSLFGLILALTVYNAAHQPRGLAVLWLVVLLVWAIGAMTLSWEHRKQTWLFLNFVVISANTIAIRSAGKKDAGRPRSVGKRYQYYPRIMGKG